MGAFGLNGSILDAANLAWKICLVAQQKARLDALLPTYNSERRKHAVRIIEVSGSYLRFVCGSALPLPNLRDVAALDAQGATNGHTNGGSAASGETLLQYEHSNVSKPSENGNGHANGVPSKGKPLGDQEEKHHGEGNTQAEDLGFLGNFFKNHGQFLLGVDCPYEESTVVASQSDSASTPTGIRVKSGVRAPNPRLCLSSAESGYLYDKLAGPPRFHLVLFASSLKGTEVRRRVDVLFQSLNSPDSFYARFGGTSRFQLVVVLKMLPFEWQDSDADVGLASVKDALPADATVLFDDRS